MRAPLVLVILTAFIGQAIAQSKVKYDSAWWQSVSMNEQETFISGYFDCYIYGANRTTHVPEPIEEAVAYVTKYYNSNPNARGVTVPEILRTLPGPRKKVPKKDRHGVYDGDFWRQSTSKERVGFLSGYIACRTLYTDVRYSRPVQSYADAMSKWYGVSDGDESQLSVITGDEKIAAVLERIRKAEEARMPYTPRH
jgi:hypothetical protein